MSNHLDDAALLAAELLARRWLPRQHPKVKRALIDAELWTATSERLAQVGLRLIDNLYADHVSVALLRGAESTVFGETGLNSHNNIDLPRDAVSLLVVLWALIILPKRERQAARAANQHGDTQNDMFGKDRPMPTAATSCSAACAGSTTGTSSGGTGHAAQQLQRKALRAGVTLATASSDRQAAQHCCPELQGSRGRGRSRGGGGGGCRRGRQQSLQLLLGRSLCQQSSALQGIPAHCAALSLSAQAALQQQQQKL